MKIQVDSSKILASQTIYKYMTPYLEKYQCKNIGDLFCGTGEMSKILFPNYSLIMNDHMYHSCLITESQLIYYPEIKKRIEILNQVVPVDGMISKKFTNGFLSMNNARKIDAMRIQIEEWYMNYEISRLQYTKLMGVFLFCMDYYLNHLNPTLEEDEIPEFKIQNLFDVDQIPRNYYVFANEDILKLNLESIIEKINFRMDHHNKIELDSVYLNLVHQRSKFSYLLETVARYDDSQIKEEIFNKNRMKEIAKKLENVPLIFIRYNGGLKDMKIARVFEDLGRKVEVIKIDLGRKRNQKSMIDEFLLVVE
jgi:adenine-specific DNA-methyltransferase